MNTEHTKHPCETVEAGHEVMKLAGMILSDCGCSTAISDSLQRRVAGRIQLHMDSVAQQLELERGRLFAESQRKQQLQDQVGALLAAMDVIALGELPDGKYANISTMMYAEEACKAAKRAPIKESLTADQQAEPVALSLPFFAYDSETGFERFATEAKAKAAAQESIDTYREEAGEGWAEAVENICWGVVLGTTREVALPDNYDGAFGLADAAQFVDYMLTDAAQPPAVAVPGVKQNIGTLPVKDRYFLCRCEKCGWLGSSEECRESINHMCGDGDYYCPACGANGPDEMYEAEATFNAMLAAAPQAADPIKRLIAMHNELLGEYPYCYFELAYTRRTDWMAWLCTKPREDDPERKVLACGQGLTAEEACAEAISAAQKGGAA